MPTRSVKTQQVVAMRGSYGLKTTAVHDTSKQAPTPLPLSPCHPPMNEALTLGHCLLRGCFRRRRLLSVSLAIPTPTADSSPARIGVRDSLSESFHGELSVIFILPEQGVGEEGSGGGGVR